MNAQFSPTPTWKYLLPEREFYVSCEG
jgi:hypothetical protein